MRPRRPGEYDPCMTDASYDAAADPTRVNVRAVHSDLEADLVRLEKFTSLLDAQFNIGGVEFGYDALIGLVPGAGDLVTSAMAMYPVYLAHKHDLGKWAMVRMLGNVGLDFLLGLTPVLGDVADVAFKANRRNTAIFRKAVEKRRGRPMPR